MLAGIGNRAVVGGGLTGGPRVPSYARAGVGPDVIGTCPAILTRIRAAIVDDGSAGGAGISSLASASIAIYAICSSAAFQTRIGAAVVDVRFTVGA